MEKLGLYELARSVPEEAKKAIKGGRMSGKTDINPMWRIKKLTELFGPVGFGWYYDISEKRLEPYSNGEVAAFVQINLFVKMTNDSGNEIWSKPIVGVGGNMFVTNESKGPYLSDECFKMALTDAISVACKAIGIGADVYWEADRTKYSSAPDQQKKKPEFDPLLLNDEERMLKTFEGLFKSQKTPIEQMRSWFEINNETLAEVVERFEKYMRDGQLASNNG
jgi:hypothetical protein